MLRVGLTGGIASGKSAVSQRLASYGAVVVDADAVAREVVAPGTPGLAEVVTAFGTQILGPDGSLDRAAMARIVFADPQRRAALNAIVHPLVSDRMAALAAAAPAGAVVVFDVPLIAENGLADSFDLVVVVDTPAHSQLDRLVRLRDMTREHARARIAAQVSREERLAVADIVIDNSGSLAELDRQSGDLWAELRRRAKESARGNARGSAHSGANGSANSSADGGAASG
jgi:dephospho-CoA kinase